jgi:hypothetical protein
MKGREGKDIKYFRRKLKEEDTLEDLGIDRRITLKWIV